MQRIVSLWDATSQRHRSSPPILTYLWFFVRGVFRLIRKRRCAKGLLCEGQTILRSVLGGWFVKKGKSPPLFPQDLGISKEVPP